MNHTFTKRKHETFTIKEKGTGSITTTEHTGFGVPEWVIPQVVTGGTYTLELYRFNDIAGIINEEGEYLFHRSDEYFKMKLEQFIEDNRVKGERRYQENKADYIKRTKELPERYSNRLNRFLNDPESAENFRKEPMGWGYELIICELAVLYEMYPSPSGKWEEEHAEVKAFAKEHGTSGNQHDVARSWANDPTRAI